MAAAALLLLAASAAPGAAAGRGGDDCDYYSNALSYAESQRDFWSDELAFDQWSVSNAIATGAPQSVVDAYVQECVQDGFWVAAYQQDVEQFGDAKRAACR